MVQISIIIPVYNTEKYIVECIQSVLSNDYKDVEVICVDDGSTDSSLEKMQQLAKESSCIKVLSQENKGQSAARNLALSNAQGKYVYFLDSDDKISENALGSLHACLEEYNLDVLYFSGDSFYDTEQLAEQFNQFQNSYLREGVYEGCDTGLEILQQVRDNGDYSVSPCIQIIRREFLTENNITFYEGIIHEDNIFSLKVIINAKRAKCINDIYFHRRIREDSVMTSNKTHMNLLGYYRCFLELLDYLDEKDFISEYEDLFNRILRGMKRNIQRNYAAIDEEEREAFYSKVSLKERMLFKSTILQQIQSETKLNKQLSKKQKELNKLKSSKAFKVGKFVTWPFRKAQKIVKSIRGRLMKKV